jgi:transglutaminase-like putative cysteine protease
MMRISARDTLILTQLMMILPHVNHMPYWLTGLGLFSIVIQLEFIKRKLLGEGKANQRAVQGLVFVAGMAGIAETFKTIQGLEAGTAFLLVCLLGKLFEIKTRRDVYVVLTLDLFIISGMFLFDQNLSTALWAMLATLVVLYAMLMQNLAGASIPQTGIPVLLISDPAATHGGQRTGQRGALRTLFLIVGMAVPLMMILFVFFPRIPPLWTIHLAGGQAKTGMSDSMAPGDFAKLSQSSELAFRATFDSGRLPQKKDLYWRGMVFSHFDGRSWSLHTDPRLKETVWGSDTAPQWLKSIPLNEPRATAYKIIMEPTQQSWLFALSFPLGKTPQVGLTREFNVIASEDITQRTTFELYRFNARAVDLELPEWMQSENLQLPDTGNPRSQAFARLYFSKYRKDPLKYADGVMSWIRQENFVYTLQPPTLSGDRVDQFLFQTRRGFCEHYASAFTYLMRAAGIPARVVVGYQGGQEGRDGQSIEVRQMDAHAWSEIWLTGRGWVRYDPTSAVAPERIELGMSDLSAQSQTLFGDGVAGTLRYNRFKVLERAREWADYASYVWQRDIVGFSQDSQENFLYKWFGLKDQMQQILVMGLAFLGVLALGIAVMMWRKRAIWHPLDIPMRQLSKRLAKKGLARVESEGVLQWLERVGRVPRYHQSAQLLARAYSEARYSSETATAAQAKQIKKLVRKWPSA